MHDLEITLIEKFGGPLTKKIVIDEAGSLKSDGSACVMTRGLAFRFRLNDLDELASAIEG